MRLLVTHNTEKRSRGRRQVLEMGNCNSSTIAVKPFLAFALTEQSFVFSFGDFLATNSAFFCLLVSRALAFRRHDLAHTVLAKFHVIVLSQRAPFLTTLTFSPHAAIVIFTPTSVANKILTVAVRLGYTIYVRISLPADHCVDWNGKSSSTAVHALQNVQSVWLN